MKKRLSNCGVIEIGANSVKLGIFEYKKNQIVALDHLTYPVNLGHEIFNFGFISIESINELISIIDRYKLACKSFGIEEIIVISATVMRESLNSSVLADRIKISNGLDIRVLLPNEEKSLIYYNIINRLCKEKEFNEKSIIVYIGSGSIGLACFDGRNVTQAHNIPLGALKLNDMLKDLRKHMSDYHLVVEEYLHSIFDKLNIEFSNYNTLILTGNAMDNLVNIAASSSFGASNKLSYDSIRKFYKKIRSLTSENVSAKYNIPEDVSDIFSTTLSISYSLIKFMNKSTNIIVHPVDMEEIIAAQHLATEDVQEYEKHIYNGAITSSKWLASKYNCNSIHYEAVRNLSCQIFDKTKKLHGIDNKYRSILEIASILHSCGEYVNARQRAQSSYDIIKNLDIYGISESKSIQVAYISSFNEIFSPNDEKSYLQSLLSEEKIILAKLIAIFRIANALDKSQKAKLHIEKIQLKENQLIITATSEESSLLEQWAFDQCSEYFTEIFGVIPKLVVKSQLL